MAFLNDRVLDFGLDELVTNGNRIDLCSQEPNSYAEATTTYTLGNKTGITVTGPADGSPNGRSATVGAISDGTVTSSGSATHYAITDTVNSRLLATQTLAAGTALATGSPWTSTAFAINIPDPA